MFSSISRAVTVLLVGSVGFFVGLTALLLVTLQYQQTVQRVSAKTSDLTAIIGALAAEHLLTDSHEQLSRDIAQFGYAELLQHIHIYRVDGSSGATSYFTSFNATAIAAIPIRTAQVHDLVGVRLTERYYEAAEPIYLADRLLGYVYVRASRQSTDAALHNGIFLAVVITSCALLLAYLLALRLRRYITTPVNQLVDSVNTIAGSKDYGLRIGRAKLMELDSLTKAFDLILGRIQQHIQRQHIAEQQASQLNAELEGQVSERTEALKIANRELIKTLETLHQYQQELVEAKKMSALGDMVAGVAHEMNTPVGLVITSSSIMQDSLANLAEKFSQKTMTSNDFQRFLESSHENLALLERNIQLTADLVTRFQQLSMDQFAEPSRDFDMATFCDDVVAALHSRFSQLKQFPLRLQCPRPLWVNSRPGPLNQIINQLVHNSLQHGFEHRQSGHIDIAIALDSDSGVLQIDYRDDGEGMSEQLLDKVFEPFTTSKRSSGATGLGLHFVYNLVRQVLKGSIEISSEPNRGTNVKITIANALATGRHDE